MAELDDSLKALVDPPFAPPPPLAELEDRARRHRTRRLAGGGAAAAVAVVALVAGVVALQPGGEQTVHTASSGGGRGDGANVTGPPTVSMVVGAPIATLQEFDAVGAHWKLVVSRGAGEEICLSLVPAGGAVIATPSPMCWLPLQSVQFGVTGATDLTYLFGLAPKDVTGLGIYEPGPRGLDILGKDLGLPATFFGYVVPATVNELTLSAVAPGRETVRLPVELHRRVSSVNGDVAAPAVLPRPTTTAGPGTAPGAPPTTGPLPPTTAAPPVTAPPTTLPPIVGGGAKRISVSPNVFDLRKTKFEAAAASGTQSVAVRFWAGVEPCTLLGRVDVVESATTVRITVWTGNGPELIMCTAQAVLYETVVELSSPLGTRTIIDGAA